MKTNFLTHIYAITQERIASLSLPELKEQVKNTRKPRPFIKKESSFFIAEVKFTSPIGMKSHRQDAVTVAAEYLSHGASAISILTEPFYFNGSIDNLIRIRQNNATTPLLMKDFILDERQLYVARIAGADIILLIKAFLSDARFASLYEKALSLNLTPLVEVHTEKELRFVESLSAELIGVNNRNLHNLNVDLNVAEKLIDYAKGDATYIAMSGIEHGHYIYRLQQKGYQGFLIGSYCMTSSHPGKALAQLIRESNDAS